MKTPYLEEEINELSTLNSRNDLSTVGKAKLAEYQKILEVCKKAPEEATAVPAKLKTKISKRKVYVHQGEDRPLVYVSNFGDVTLKKGARVFVENNYVYVSGVFEYQNYHRHTSYLSNMFPYTNYGILSEEAKCSLFMDKMLTGSLLTPLEIDTKCIAEIAASLPKHNFHMAHYQFSNKIRPVSLVMYNELTDSYTYASTASHAVGLAWYMYRNVFRMLPPGTTSCSAEYFETLPTLYTEYKPIL